MTTFTLQTARDWDLSDPLAGFRDRFSMPAGLVYLDGNSLGALPRSTPERIARVVQQEWGEGLVRSWNAHGWINVPMTLGAKISRLVGAAEDEVVVTDTTSVNLFRLVLAALGMQQTKTEVVAEAGDFSTDLYIAQAATSLYGHQRTTKLVPREQLVASISERTALVLLTHVHYKTGEIYDMTEISRIAHERGALMLWDLSHSVGALPVELNDSESDFAVGCGYKYLNGGPGAPAFQFIARRHHRSAINAISGWHGHAQPFDFSDHYIPAPGIRQYLSGTPGIIGSAALEEGVDLTLEAGVDRIASKSRRLSELFLALVESTCAGYDLVLVSPRDPKSRGSHLSYAHPHGYEVMQALIAESVIGDFRAPDLIRFGFSPLYTRFEDVWIAVERLRNILQSERWRAPRYAERAAVT
jgi:kynureninase